MLGSKKRVIFFGSDGICIPVLEYLYNQGMEKWELVAIVSQPDSKTGRGRLVQSNPVSLYAKDNGIRLFQPNKPNEELINWIKENSIDLSFVMAYGHFLSKALRSSTSLGCYNFHGSILPKYRGASPIETAIASGDQTTGITLMKVEAGMDAGPIADTEMCKIEINDTSLILREKLANKVVALLERNIEKLINKNINFVAQKDEGIVYCRKLTKSDGLIDFNLSAKEIYNRWRAFYSWPGTYFFYHNKRIKVGLVELVKDYESKLEKNYKVGAILESKNRLLIGTKKGIISLAMLQKEGGKMLKAKEFLKGFEFKLGEQIQVSSSNTLTTLRKI